MPRRRSQPQVYHYTSPNPPSHFGVTYDDNGQPIDPGLTSYTPPPERDAQGNITNLESLPEMGNPMPALPQGYSGTSMPQYMHDAVYRLLDSAYRNSQSPYSAYNANTRFEPMGLNQVDAQNAMRAAINAPPTQGQYDAARQSAETAMNQSAMGNRARGFIDKADRDPTSQYQQYMDPYQSRVLDVLERRSNRNLTENILPSIRSNFISQGSYNSGKRNEMEARAARDNQESLMNQQAAVLSQGYDKALGQVNTDQQKQLQAANLLSNTAQSDLWRQGTGGKDLMNQAAQAQRDKLMQLDILNQVGAQERGVRQLKKDFEYQQWQEKQDHPYVQQARLNESVRGLPATGTTTRQAQYTPQQAPITSPYSMAGGILGALGQSNAARQSARGGHYAEGGSVTQGVADQSSPNRENMLAIANNFISGHQNPQTNLNPTNMMLARMYAHAAANPVAGNPWAAMGSGMPAAMETFENTHNQNNKNQMQAAALFDLIEKSKETERQNKAGEGHKQLELAHKGKELELDRAFKMGNLDLGRQGLALKKEMLSRPSGKSTEQEKQDIKSKAKALENAQKLYDSGAEELASLERMHELSKEAVGNTGPFWDAISPVTESWEIVKGRAGSRGAFKALGAKTLASITSQQKGVQSDRDMAIWAEAVPSLAKTPTTNAHIANIGIALARRKMKHADFVRDNLDKKPIAEIERAWSDYVNENPLFENVPLKSNVVKPNIPELINNKLGARKYKHDKLNVPEDTSDPTDYFKENKDSLLEKKRERFMGMTKEELIKMPETDFDKNMAMLDDNMQQNILGRMK